MRGMVKKELLLAVLLDAWTKQPHLRLRQYDPEYKKWFNKAREKLDKLIEKAIKDGVMDKETSEWYIVELYPF